MLINPVSYLTNCIRNAYVSRRSSFLIKAIPGFLPLLKKICNEGFLSYYTFVEKGKMVIVTLSYTEDNPVLQGLNYLSKIGSKGKKISVSVKKIKFYVKKKNSPSLLIISTKKGLRNHHQALRENIGGQAILRLY